MSVAHSIDPGTNQAVHAIRSATQAASSSSATGMLGDDGDAVSSFTALLPSDLIGAALTGGAAASSALIRAGVPTPGMSGITDMPLPTAPAASNIQTQRTRQDDNDTNNNSQAQSRNGAAQAANNAAASNATDTDTDKRTGGSRHARKGDQDSDIKQASNSNDGAQGNATILPFAPVDLPLPSTTLPDAGKEQAASASSTVQSAGNAADSAQEAPQAQPDAIRFVKADTGANAANAQPNTQQGPAGTGTTQVKVTTTAAPLTAGGAASPAQAVAAQQAASDGQPTNAVTAQVAHDEAAAGGRLAPDETQPAPQPQPANATAGNAPLAGNSGAGTDTADSGDNADQNPGQNPGQDLAGKGGSAKTAAAIGLAAKAALGEATSGAAEQPTGFASVMSAQGGTALPGVAGMTGTAATATAQNLAQPASEMASANSAQRMAIPLMPSDQLAAAIQRLAPVQRSFSMQLTPEHLGQVDVRLNIDAKGNAKATFTADKPETLVLLQQDSHHLVDALQNAGIQVDQNSLSFSLRDGGQGSQNNGGFEQSAGSRGDSLSQGGQGSANDTDDAANGQQNRSSHLYDLHA